MVKTGLAASNGEARRAIQQGGVSVNDEKVTDLFRKYTKDEIASGDFMLRKGKKSYKKLTVE